MIEPHIISAIINSGFKGVFAITGGGTEAIPALLRNGGGSAVFLDGRTPYSTKAFVRFVGTTPSRFCSVVSADLLADKALEEAGILADPTDKNLFGLGVTATLAKNGEERADRVHQAFITVAYSIDGKVAHSRADLTLIKAPRIEEEATLVRHTLSHLAAVLTTKKKSC